MSPQLRKWWILQSPIIRCKGGGSMRQYLKCMRVRHYIKNFLIFVALACSGQLFSSTKLFSGIVGFVAFCMVSSVIYIINDIQDREKDCNHPTKCKRPIAAGKVSVKRASLLAIVLLLIAIICNGLIFHVASTLLLALFLILNLGYSFGLKNIPIVDVTILVAGFLIRIMYGAFITEISVSNWLYLTVITLAFYFALGKRRNELKLIGDGETRQVLKAYPLNFLDRNMGMYLTAANVFYALWSMEEKTTSFYNYKNLIFTVPIVFLITMKYSLDIERESDGDPVEVLLHDRILLVLCALYLVVMFMILYLS